MKQSEDYLFVPTILSGGSGTRLWPLSRKDYPKQLQALIDEKSLLQNITSLITTCFDTKPYFITNVSQRFKISEQLSSYGIENDHIILEPSPKNTAAAAFIAALNGIKQAQEQGYDDAIILLLPSDHYIQDYDGFKQTIEEAFALVMDDHIVTLGIEPKYPETGYGYIQAGQSKGGNAFLVDSFKEKPNKQRAKEFLAEGGYYWNSGIFVYSAKFFAKEIEKFAPCIFQNASRAFEKAYDELKFLLLDDVSFDQCDDISVDYAVMEKTQAAAMVKASFDWADLGSWLSVWQTDQNKDEQGNVILDDVFAVDCENSYLRSASNRTIAAIGLSDVVVVDTDDAVIVMDKNASQGVKDIVDELKAQDHPIATEHLKQYYPWGTSKQLVKDEAYIISHINISPRCKLSLHYHYHSNESWNVLKGTARVIIDDKEQLLTAGQSVYIPSGKKHRVENPGSLNLEMICMRSGEFLGSSDIIVIEDEYNRHSLTPEE